jgi:ribosomal protein L7/L12
MEPNENMNIDRYLTELRKSGTSLIDAIKVIRERQQVSLGEAKRIVLNSPAWADAKEAQARLFDEIVTALELERCVTASTR